MLQRRNLYPNYLILFVELKQNESLKFPRHIFELYTAVTFNLKNKERNKGQGWYA